MKPEVLAALPEFEQKGILPPESARLARRLAARELASVELELRLLFYGGVLLFVSGVGLLVKENLEQIGPVTIAFAIGLIAAGALAWIQRKAPSFAWSEVPSPHPAFDYVLLLGVLLLAADLAYIEVQFTPLGPSWAWHLLIVASVYFVAALRYDSRIVLSLSLSTFAAWRGVSLEPLDALGLSTGVLTRMRFEAIAVGAAYAALGWLMVRYRRKAHFEPVLAHAGWLLILGGCGAGLGDDVYWLAWCLGLLAAAALLGFIAWKGRHFSLFALAVLAGYVAVFRVIFESLLGQAFGCLLVSGSAIGLVFLLIRVNRIMKEAPE